MIRNEIYSYLQKEIESDKKEGSQPVLQCFFCVQNSKILSIVQQKLMVDDNNSNII